MSKRKYDYVGNNSFEHAYGDCKYVADSIIDERSFQESDTGLLLYNMDRILEALKKQIAVKVKIYNEEVLKCPCCHEELGYFKINDEGYCMECGQKIKFVE